MKANKLLKFKRSLMAMGVAGLFAGAVACGQPKQQSGTEEPAAGDTEMMEEESEFGELEEDTTSAGEQLPAEEDTL